MGYHVKVELVLFVGILYQWCGTIYILVSFVDRIA